jgi:pantetheine-phosphate adenylyltransferase
MKRIALFPGSFDPITIAHIDILNRALPLFDQVIIGIGLNSQKEGFFPAEKRMEFLKAIYEGNETIKVMTYEGLTVKFCTDIGARYIIRGIRSASDFEYEKAIAQMNHAMYPQIESLFILSKPGYSAISSTIVRDIIRNGGDVSQFVPPEVVDML